jgi:hypothetical protein
LVNGSLTKPAFEEPLDKRFTDIAEPVDSAGAKNKRTFSIEDIAFRFGLR